MAYGDLWRAHPLANAGVAGGGFWGPEWVACRVSGDGSKIFVITEKVLKCTSDGGVTWDTLYTETTHKLTGLAASSTGAKIYLSRKAGLAGTYYGALIYSHDSGANWTATSEIMGSASTVDCSSDGSVIIRSVSSIVYISSDSGANWTTQHTVTTPSVVCSGNGLVLAVKYTVNTTTRAFKVSTNGGSSWSTVTDTLGTTTPIGRLSSDGSAWLRCAIAGVYKSTDYGDSWTKLANHDTYTLAVSEDGTKITVCAYPSIQCSTDSGATWSAKTTTLPAGQGWRDVSSSDDGGVLCATTAQGAPIINTIAPFEVFRIYDVEGDIAGGDEVYIETGGTEQGLTADLGGAELVDYTLDEYSWWIVGTSSPHPSGLVDVRVVNPDTSEAILEDGFEYQGDLGIDSITPAEGPTAGGTAVTISGIDFKPETTVTIDGNPLADVVVVDMFTITGTTPPGTVGAKDVVVTNP